MKAPAFWSNPPDRPGSFARVLSPLSLIWQTVTRRRLARPPGPSVGRPVICVGNLTAGGAGKTPTVAALIDLLSARGRTPAVVTRGFGGRLEGPVQVDLTTHSAQDVGDEALLHAALAPTWVAKDRGAGARAARGDVILLDDGFQNPVPAKDLSIIVIDAAQGFGNGRVIPAGPLREPVRNLARADLLVLIGPPADRATFHARWPDLPRPVLEGELRPLRTGISLSGLPVLAFAGIGRPEKFFATLRDLGAELRGTRALPDHAPLTPHLLTRLRREAKDLQAQLVTTEKDAARLSPKDRAGILVVPVRLQLEDAAPLEARLEVLDL